jgi:hypothetical protein
MSLCGRMKKNSVGEQVEEYLNGNTEKTKAWLRKASKIELLEFAEMLNDAGHNGLYETKRLVR